jgi:drug/metabolite transporter (DMT)-like permease
LPPEATAAALLSAVIHAAWNAVLKGGRDRLVVVSAMGIGAVAFGIALLAWRGFPPRPSWPFLAASAVVHVLYWLALTRSYASGDMSHVYTIARGLAPALVAVGALLVAHEMPSLFGAIGIGLISLGIAAIGVSRRAPKIASAWAGATAVTIATYSILDGLGARASGDAIAYIGASALGTYLPIIAYGAMRRGVGPIVAALPGDGLRFVGAGVASEVGFGLALWAQTIAPIAYVTALRETSVVFGAIIAASILREPVGHRRWLGAIVVAAGAALLVTL